MAKDIGKEQYPNNPLKAQDLQDHLWRNCIEESYSINFYKGSIKFTTTWSQQKEYEKYKNIPEVVRRELR